MKTPARLSLLSITVATLALAGLAAPASAAGTRTLPDGNSLYAITCPYYSDDSAQTPKNQVLVVDELTAVATAIGAGTDIDGANCAGSPSVDPTTGTVYALVAVDDYDFPTLVTVDLATGASVKVADITYGGDPAIAQALAIGTDGSAFVLADGFLYSLNLGDGTLTDVAESLADVWGFVSDPVTGLFYAVDENGEVFEVDVTDGSSTSLGQLPFVPGTDSYSLTLDSNGIFWMGLDISSVDQYQMELWSFTLVDPAGSGQASGILAVGGIAPYSEALVIGPKYVAPALANTGTDAVPLVGAGVLALLAGGLLVGAARRRGRTA